MTAQRCIDIFCHFLVYNNRKKYGNYYAAQFNDVDSDLKKVEKWVKSNPKLNLLQKK